MIPAVHLYISQIRREIIVAATGITSDGVYYEKECGATAYSLDTEPVILGTTVRSALSDFATPESAGEIIKKSAWPALLVSKAKSVRAFESRTVCIGIRFTGNEFEFRGSAFEDRQRIIDRGLPTNCSNQAIGKMIFDVFWTLRKTQYQS